MMHLLPSLALFAAAVFATTLAMNLVRKNSTLVGLYLLQSLVLAIALVAISATTGAPGLLGAALLTFVVKAVVAPAFLLRMIRKYRARLSAASYLNIPLSLLALAGITTFAYTFISPSLAGHEGAASISLLFASIFGTLFLMSNRRGALATIVGVLSLENSVVLLAAIMGVEHSFALEFAITVDIALWVAVSAEFLAMMYRQFGEVDAAALAMNQLTED